jgi:hypothetical protein
VGGWTARRRGSRRPGRRWWGRRGARRKTVARARAYDEEDVPRGFKIRTPRRDVLLEGSRVKAKARALSVWHAPINKYIICSVKYGCMLPASA